MLAAGWLPRKAGVEMAYGFVMCGVRSTHNGLRSTYSGWSSTHNGLRSTYNAQNSTHSGAKQSILHYADKAPSPFALNIVQTYI